MIWSQKSVDLSEKRAEWICNWVEITVAAGVVKLHDFSAVLGRFSFSIGKRRACSLAQSSYLHLVSGMCNCLIQGFISLSELADENWSRRVDVALRDFAYIQIHSAHSK